MVPETPLDVLLVDDDADVLELTATLLEREGDLRVETASSAEAGLDLLAEGTFDCIVSDYDMPGTDGLEFLTAVRERGLELPFILFTGHGNEAVASEAISAGVSDYLQKGTGTEQYEVLANRIRNYTAQYRAEREIDRVRRRHELVARAVSDVIFEWDSESDHIDFSGGYAAQFGVEPPTAPTQGWWLDQIHPDDRDAVVERLDDAIADRESQVHVEYRFDPGDGDYRYVSEDRHHRFEDGDVESVVGAFRDVTDRREPEYRQEALHEASRDLMTAESVDAVVDIVSCAADEILDLPLHAVFRRDGDVLVPVATTERAREVFGELPTFERGDALLWEVVGGDEPQVYDNLIDVEGLYNPETPARSEFHLPFGEFGAFIAGSTTPDDVSEADVHLAQILLANAEAALERVRAGDATGESDSSIYDGAES
jgi:PAS domain S-box-containing protein